MGGYKTTPSMVAIAEDGKRLVGHIAKRQAITNAENTVYAAKRLIGRKWGSAAVRSSLEIMPYRIVEGPHDDVRIMLRDQVFSRPRFGRVHPPGDEADLRGVPRRRESEGRDHGPGVLQRRPAPGDQGRRPHRRPRRHPHHQRADGGRARVRLRPQHRAQGRGLRPRRRHVRHLDPRDRQRRVRGASRPRATRSSAARTSIARIIDWLVFGFEKQHGIDLRKDKMALQRLKDAAEKAKCELSTALETEINLPFIVSTRANEAPADDADARQARGARRTSSGALEGPCKERPRSRRPEARADRHDHPRRRPDAHAEGPADGRDDLREAAEPLASTRTRSSRSAPRSRRASCAATSRTSSSSTSRRCRSASRRTAASS